MTNLKKFLTGALVTIILFSLMVLFLFLGMILPMIFAVAFGPFIGIFTLLIGVGIIGGCAALFTDML